jgi:hypothetical protein
VAAVLGLAAVTLSAAPASADAETGCRLSIDQQSDPAYYDVTVFCVPAGQGIISFELWGSDGWPNPDDYLTTIYSFHGVVTGDVLNEDIGARDEIYAKAKFVGRESRDYDAGDQPGGRVLWLNRRSPSAD